MSNYSGYSIDSRGKRASGCRSSLLLPLWVNTQFVCSKTYFPSVTNSCLSKRSDFPCYTECWMLFFIAEVIIGQHGFIYVTHNALKFIQSLVFRIRKVQFSGMVIFPEGSAYRWITNSTLATKYVAVDQELRSEISFIFLFVCFVKAACFIS